MASSDGLITIGPTIGTDADALDTLPQSVFIVEPTVASPEEQARPTRKLSGKRRLFEWTVVLSVAFILALVIRAFVFGAFYIPSNSMEPSLLTGDRILVNKLSYTFSEPSYGDLVVFFPPETAVDIAQMELIKRVVAVGGDNVQIRGGVLYRNGIAVDEEYLPASAQNQNRDFPHVDVPPNHVFVMGDNRANSRDSRQFGPVPVENMVGRAFVTYWPPSSMGGL